MRSLAQHPRVTYSPYQVLKKKYCMQTQHGLFKATVVKLCTDKGGIASIFKLFSKNVRLLPKNSTIFM